MERPGQVDIDRSVGGEVGAGETQVGGVEDSGVGEARFDEGVANIEVSGFRARDSTIPVPKDQSTAALGRDRVMSTDGQQ